MEVLGAEFPDVSAPAGWHPDPAGNSSLERYWDGSAWTEETRAIGSMAPSTLDSTDLLTAIEVSRQFNVWIGIAHAWDVFVDGDRVGMSTNGKAIRVTVQPGIRTVTIWNRRRKACSDDLALDVQPGTVRYLHCRVNKAQFWRGLQGGHKQRFSYSGELGRQIQEAGGANRGGILLYEDPRLVTPPWGTSTT